MTRITSTDPRSGKTVETDIEATSEDEVEAIALKAVDAFRELKRRPRSWRAGMLRALSTNLEAHRDDLVSAAEQETGLNAARLGGELSRTTYQLELFADAIIEGSYLEATIDHAGQSRLGPVPDIRRMLVPIGPVAVFGSSNFPFAFSVPGGDTASALAAGNPVIVKAHSSHPITSRLAFEAMVEAAATCGSPPGTLGIVYGQRGGANLVANSQVAAVGFTGSLSTGRILLNVIQDRERPIPFYGELSSINPLIVTPGAIALRGEVIADGLFQSFTGSAGQMCTKPGIAFIPHDADSLVAALVARATSAPAQTLLSEKIFAALGEIRQRLVAQGRARVLVEASIGEDGFSLTPGILEVNASDLNEATSEEAFGPLIVLARYAHLGEVSRALSAIPDSLTGTIHMEPSELSEIEQLVERLEQSSGRVVFNGYPTGVRVSWGQHHGGPWPATNSAHTSVGVSAIRRFLRPLAWQDAPEAVLPIDLRDSTRALPRRVDGVLELASGG